MTAWAADFSSAQLKAAQLKGAGYCGAIRYIIGKDKQITADEFRDLTTTPGMTLTLVNETVAQAAQDGFQRGRAEAFAAFGRADRLGWPKTKPIYFVCEDPNHLPAPQWAAIEQYLRGVLSVVPVSRVGDYGSADQIDHMMALGLTTYGWAVETWPGRPDEWSPESRPQMHVVQMYNAVADAPHNFNGQVDPDLILKDDWGQWTALVYAAPVYSGEEATMLAIAYGPNGRVDICWIAPNKSIWHSWSPSLVTALAPGAPVEQLGIPGKDYMVSVSCQWSPDGSTFVVSGQGIDNLAYMDVYTAATGWSGFVQIPTVSATKGLLHRLAGPAGKAGDPGPTYDDSAITARVTKLEAEVLAPPAAR